MSDLCEVVPGKLDRRLRCIRGHEEGQRDGDKTTPIHSAVQGQGDVTNRSSLCPANPFVEMPSQSLIQSYSREKDRLVHIVSSN